MSAKLPREFFARDARVVAKALLGKVLVHADGGARRAVRVVETEAYHGRDDEASHARFGPTRRAAIMFGDPGVAYVYLIYGLSHCFNVVTGRKPFRGDELGDVIVKICSDPVPRVRDFVPDLPPSVDLFFQRALERNPALRFQSAREMAASFQAIVAQHLGIPVGKSRLVKFSNENMKVRIEENVREADVFVVQTSCPPVSDNLLELLITIDALRGASARRITAVLPYYAYVRSDKKDEPRISITARLVADLLETAGANRVLTLDLHSPQVQGFFRIPADQLTATPILVEHFRQRPDLADHVVVAPDAGEVKDAARFAKRLGVPLAIVDKRRYGDDEQAHAVTLVGDVKGKRALVIDDEIATGGTVLQAVDFLRREGVKDVSVAVIHPVLSGQAVERLRAAPIAELVITDSIPLPPAKQDPRFTILSVARLVAEAIARVHDGRSISEMYD